jgi:hypothetical protein
VNVGNGIIVCEHPSDNHDTTKRLGNKIKRIGKIVAIYPHYIVVEFQGKRQFWHEPDANLSYRKSYLKVDVMFNFEREFEVIG